MMKSLGATKTCNDSMLITDGILASLCKVSVETSNVGLSMERREFVSGQARGENH
jgi:hypothetical protein